MYKGQVHSLVQQVQAALVVVVLVNEEKKILFNTVILVLLILVLVAVAQLQVLASLVDTVDLVVQEL